MSDALEQHHLQGKYSVILASRKGVRIEAITVVEEEGYSWWHEFHVTKPHPTNNDRCSVDKSQSLSRVVRIFNELLGEQQ